jgi:hypothetical protein
VLVYTIGLDTISSIEYNRADAQTKTATTTAAVTPVPVLDTAAYDAKLLALANRATSTLAVRTVATSTASTSVALATTTPKTYLWPAKAAYPDPGPLLPFNRIVAYYGNFYSKGMGVLGQYPPSQMIPMLQKVALQWTAADPTTPVIPAIDYIAVTAQGSAGADGKYRLRMPDSQIDEAVALAAQMHGIVILDVQVGLSNVQTEVPLLEKYLKMPQVHLALDPEFAMHGGAKPGTVIGSLDASDINWAANYLAKLVQENNLPPKVLIVHRFTEDMVTHVSLIKPLPEVQFIMDMDGWGSQAKKIGTYTRVIYPEPVQFTGFKLFYKNDLLAPSTGMLTPAQVLKLTPQPSFIQYQ